MEELYKNRDWLHQKYIVEKLSTFKIAKICGYSCVTIGDWLKRHNIKIRTLSEAATGELNPRYCLLEERLWKKIDKKDNISECWPWIGCKGYYGHGQISGESGGKIRYAHTVMYEVFYKDKIEKGECVHHLCENKSCCNPFHLVKMKHKEHSSLHHKGRWCGEKSSSAKLTWKKVRKIREKYKTGKHMQKELAKEHNIDQGTISDIVNNKTWRE